MVDKSKYNDMRKINEYNIYLILVLDGAFKKIILLQPPNRTGM